MGNKTIYEQYKQAMLNFYNRMQKEGYKGNSAYTPMLAKDDNELLIHTNSSADRMKPEGIDFRYDRKTKKLSVFIGKTGITVDEETHQVLIPEMLMLHYYPDATMDVIHCSEDNLTRFDKSSLNEIERRLAAILKYGKNVPAISIDKLFDESDLLDELDTSYFEDLHRRFKFQAPEFDIEAEKENDIEDDEPSL